MQTMKPYIAIGAVICILSTLELIGTINIGRAIVQLVGCVAVFKWSVRGLDEEKAPAGRQSKRAHRKIYLLK